MRLVAGIDVGNATTEVIIAAVHGGVATSRWHGHATTSGRKGSTASLDGAAAVLRRGEAELGSPVDVIALAHLRPVDTAGVTLAAPRTPSVVRNLCGPVVTTPAGRGMAVGRHVPMADLTRAVSSGPIVVSVPADVDFDVAAAAIAAAAAAGWEIVAVVAGGDDAVLLHHRIGLDVPIVDEAELNGLSVGQLIAVEVVADGSGRRVLADPLALGAALHVDPTDLVDAVRELVDASAMALVAVDRPGRDSSSSAQDWVELEVDGRIRRWLLRSAGPVLRAGPPGTARRAALGVDAAARGGVDVDDAFVVDLAAADHGAWRRRGAVRLDAVTAAVLTRELATNAAALLAERTGRCVVTVTDEATAAAIGARSTPAFPPDAAVADVGGGSIDLVWRDRSVTVAGAGELMTMAVAAALDIPRGLAERVKRSPAVRVESPHLAHGEDGRRRFLDVPAPSSTVGWLAVEADGILVPFTTALAAEEWRGLRLALKQETVAANVARAMAALVAPGGTHPGALVLAGGGALDDELVRAVTEQFRPHGTVVGRADIAGTHGPRFAVAWGLVELLAERMAAR